MFARNRFALAGPPAGLAVMHYVATVSVFDITTSIVFVADGADVYVASHIYFAVMMPVANRDRFRLSAPGKRKD